MKVFFRFNRWEGQVFATPQVEVMGQCASGESCKLSPPGTSATCASTAYYPATDGTALVGAADKTVGTPRA